MGGGNYFWSIFRAPARILTREVVMKLSHEPRLVWYWQEGVFIYCLKSRLTKKFRRDMIIIKTVSDG